MDAKLKLKFPFIHFKRLKAIVYKADKHEKIRLGNVVFDRRTYKSKPFMVLDALARDKQAMAIVGHFTNPVNRKRAEYYPYFNRCLSKGEIKKINKSKDALKELPVATPEPTEDMV